MLYQAISRLDDILRRAIVLFQFEHTTAIILLLEVEDIVDISSTKSIDTLCIVSHHAYVLMATGQLPHYLLLNVVGVLILIHKHEAVTLPVFIPYLWIVVEEAEGIYQEIVEIHCVALATIIHIHRINGWHTVHIRLSVAHHNVSILSILCWQNQLILSH